MSGENLFHFRCFAWSSWNCRLLCWSQPRSQNHWKNATTSGPSTWLPLLMSPSIYRVSATSSISTNRLAKERSGQHQMSPKREWAISIVCSVNYSERKAKLPRVRTKESVKSVRRFPCASDGRCEARELFRLLLSVTEAVQYRKCSLICTSEVTVFILSFKTLVIYEQYIKCKVSV